MSAPTRLGFVGVGWIGLDRMKAIAASGLAEVSLVADTCRYTAAEAAEAVGAQTATPEMVLVGDVDGVVIATPSGLHATQAFQALRSGKAVFCQKPLGRTEAECSAVVEAAREADRLLGVDLSYRHLAATRALRDVIASGEIGEVYAADLVFHNAYGPDKEWFRDPVLSGGGCVIDLGIHLVDLAMWLLDGPEVGQVTSRLFAGGRPVDGRAGVVEDHALARIDLASGGALSLACSWNLPAGQEAVIGATFYGTRGAVSLSNVNGSFYDFRADLHSGTGRTTLVEPPDAWGGRAAVEWTRQLVGGKRFDPQAQELVDLARVLDRIYRR